MLYYQTVVIANTRIPPGLVGSRRIREYITRNIKKMKRKNRICYSMALLLALGITVSCHWVILMILASSSVEESRVWCLQFLISLAQDLVIGQFLRFLLQLIAIRALARHGVNSSLISMKIMKFLVDKLVLRSISRQ